MFEMKYTPKMCEGEDAKYTGSLLLISPNSLQRAKYLQMAKFKTNAEGSVDVADAGEAVMIMAKLINETRGHIKQIDLVRKADGEKVTDFDVLDHDPDAFPILQEVALFILKGFLPSKNSSPL
jgi:hypothetical protein